jgi:aminomethyltransferase
MCNERGGVVDDLYAYRLSGEVFLLIVNASRTEADVRWLHSILERYPRQSEVQMNDASHNYAAVAVQGPRVKEFMDTCIPGPSISGTRVARATDLQKNQVGGFRFEDSSVVVSRTGYTGEDGFEVVGGDAAICQAWKEMLARGRSGSNRAGSARATRSAPRCATPCTDTN